MKDKGYSTKYRTQGVYFIADVEDLTRDYFVKIKNTFMLLTPAEQCSNSGLKWPERALFYSCISVSLPAQQGAPQPRRDVIGRN